MRIDFYELDFIHPKLRFLVRDVQSIYASQTGKETVITSLFRIGDEGVHGTLPLRGVDIRCRDMDLGEYIADYVNEQWTYDPDRPHMKCVIFHDTGSGLHLHLQVHPRSVRVQD